MLILAVDTCDVRGSLALLRDSELLQVAIHESSEDYSSWLLPAVQRVLDAGRVTLKGLQLCAVSTGPGSFTGVRVGLTTAKAWGEVYGLPIAPVSRLEALSTYSSGKFSHVAAFLDAQRAQLFGAVYRRGGGMLERVGDEFVTAPNEFVGQAVQIAGNARIEWISPDPKCLTQTERWASRLTLGETVRVVSPTLAPAIGRIGHRLAREGRLADALSLDANYVRRSDAEIFWKGGSGHGP